MQDQKAQGALLDERERSQSTACILHFPALAGKRLVTYLLLVDGLGNSRFHGDFMLFQGEGILVGRFPGSCECLFWDAQKWQEWGFEEMDRLASCTKSCLMQLPALVIPLLSGLH